MSDHLPTYVILKKTKFKHELMTFTCRTLKHLDNDRLAEAIENTDWSEFYNYPDVDECWKFMLRNITNYSR